MQVHQEQEKIVSLKHKHQEEIESQNIKYVSSSISISHNLT